MVDSINSKAKIFVSFGMQAGKALSCMELKNLEILWN